MANGTRKTHTAIARACIRRGAAGRFFNVADLVNKLVLDGTMRLGARDDEAMTRRMDPADGPG